MMDERIRKHYGLDSEEEYDFSVGVRSLLLDTLRSAGFSVPTQFESSDEVISYLTVVINNPFQNRSGEVDYVRD